MPARSGARRILKSERFRRFSTRRTGFQGDHDGVAAIEFAIVFPVALLLYLGAAEVSRAVITSRKVETLSRTVVDLLSQQPTSSQPTSTPPPSTAITMTALQTMMSASTGLLYPAPTAPLEMTLTAVDIVNKSNGQCCQANVRWSYSQSGMLRKCGIPLTPADPSAPPSPATIPATLIPPLPSLPYSISVLIADVSYAYQPLIRSSLTSFVANIGMSRTSYMLPRSIGQVILQTPGPGGQGNTQQGQVCY